LKTEFACSEEKSTDRVAGPVVVSIGKNRY
jgi:hypothetical protein